MLFNELIALHMFVEGVRPLTESETATLKKWLDALNVPGLEELITDRDFMVKTRRCLTD